MFKCSWDLEGVEYAGLDSWNDVYVLLGEIQEACRFAKMIAILRYASKSYMNWSL